MKRYFPIFGLLLLSACATPDHTPEPVALKPEAPAATPVAKESIRSQPLKHLLGRSLKAMPETPLEVRARCNFKDVAGGHGRMDLQVNKAEVKRFVAEVTIPKQGLCRFDMKHFEQTAKLPNVVLSDRETACTVRMWEQDKGVTVAFNGCQAKCSGDAFSYLWPILVDTRSGRCA